MAAGSADYSTLHGVGGYNIQRVSTSVDWTVTLRPARVRFQYAFDTAPPVNTPGRLYFKHRWR
jgi:hypothetical protein